MTSLNTIIEMNSFFEKNLPKFVSKHPGEYVVLKAHLSGINITSFHKEKQVAYHVANLPNDYSSVHHIPTSLPSKPKLYYVKGVGRVPSLKDGIHYMNKKLLKRSSVPSPADDIPFQ